MIATAGGHPLAPFVVGKEGACNDDDGEDGENDFHESSRQKTKERGENGKAPGLRIETWIMSMN